MEQMKPMEGMYEVHPPMSREVMANMRRSCGMDDATFNYSDPVPAMYTDPLWDAIWNEIKTWDVNVPTEYAGYMGATGNHVTAIFLAATAAMAKSSGTDGHVSKSDWDRLNRVFKSTSDKTIDQDMEIERLRGHIAELEAAVGEVWAVASGEKQVAMDDTQGMEWITDYLSAVYGEQKN